MRIEVNYYAWFREIFGSKEVLDIEENITVGKIVKLLKEKHPEVAGETFIIAINSKIASPDVELKDGDSIAILPPAGGG